MKVKNNEIIIGNNSGYHFHSNLYIITLKNGKKLKIWFSGSQLEEILKDYNVPYEKPNK